MFLVVNFKKINGSTTFFPKNQWSHVQLQKISMCLVIISKNIDVPSGDGYVDFKKIDVPSGDRYVDFKKIDVPGEVGYVDFSTSMYLVGLGTLIPREWQSVPTLWVWMLETAYILTRAYAKPMGYIDFQDKSQETDQCISLGLIH